MLLTLNLPVILPAKVGLFRNRRELQFGASRLWQNHRQVGRTREGGRSWGCCYKHKAHWCKLGTGSIVVSHWLSCDSLSWLVCCQVQGVRLSPSCRDNKGVSVCKVQVHLFLLGLQLTTGRRTCVRSLPTSPNPFQWDFSLLIFTLYTYFNLLKTLRMNVFPVSVFLPYQDKTLMSLATSWQTHPHPFQIFLVWTRLSNFWLLL